MKEARKIKSDALYVFICLIAIIIIEIVGIPLFNNQIATRMIEDSISRILGGIIFMIILISLGYKTLFKFKVPFLISLLIIIPSLIISINNFPIIAFFDGRTQLIEPTYTIYIYIVECLSIGFFEEIIFRGLILIVLLQKLPKTQKGVFLAVVYSSALFGIIHIMNLFAGASASDTILQVGYSFLMGMMWAIVFLKTKNIWLSMFLHATYNFFGQIMFTLGTVDGRYDVITIIVTVILAILVAVYMMYLLSKIKSEQIKDLYTFAIS
jgi:membrane protease YdiL (CAAX protease family)